MVEVVRDKTAIVGVGRTKVDRDPLSSGLLHMGKALRAAVEDAGLRASDIDGLMVTSSAEGAQMDSLPNILGLPNVRWAYQSWSHGRNQPMDIATALFAVISGQADYVAVIGRSAYQGGVSGLNNNGAETVREGWGPHLEAPPYGEVNIGAGASMAMRKYFLKYGGTEEQLGAVAIAQNRWGRLQPETFFHGRPELTLADYMNSRYITAPLRLFDYCLPGNAGFCLIVTSAERAADCRATPVYISGVQGATYGPETFVFARPGLGIGWQPEHPYSAPEMTVYKMADVKPADIDILGLFDAFSPLVLFELEESGFCKEGEALEWIQGGRTAPGGELPINTCGGGLADCESYGQGHEVDLVRQLRGEAGAAQVDGVRVGQYTSTDRSSIILTRR